MKSIVVAYDKNRGIGANNDLLWQRDLPGDLNHFKELTTGKSVIMGSRTFRSIGRPLPNRQNIVLSYEPLVFPGAETAKSLDEAYKLARSEIVIIGGGSVFQQSLPDIDTIYATEVDASFAQATVFFPPLDESWEELSREHRDINGRDKYPYDFVTYRRKP